MKPALLVLAMLLSLASFGCGGSAETEVLPAQGEVTKPPADPNTP